MTDFQTTVKPINRLSTVLFLIVLGILVILKIRESESFDTTSFFFMSLGLLMTIIVVKNVFSELRILIMTDTFHVQKQIFNIPYKTESYQISEISDLHKAYNEPENSYWSFGGLIISDKTPEILTFRYKEEFIKLGIAFNLTNLDQIINELQKRKNKP